MFEYDVLTLDIAQIVECFPQWAQKNVFLLGAAGVPEYANNGNLFRRLLRVDRERQKGR